MLTIVNSLVAPSDESPGGVTDAEEMPGRSCRQRPLVGLLVARWGKMPKQPGADLIARHLRDQQEGKREGDISVYSCPDCGGALWQLGKERTLEFRCHLGHEWTGDTLVIAKSRVLEQAIMEAVRELKEKGMLLRQLATMLTPQSATTAALIEEADQHDEHSRLLQIHLLGGGEELPVSTTDRLMDEVVHEMRRPADD
jgi:hypothetical protein